jgi:hypothetical protein
MLFISPFGISAVNKFALEKISTESFPEEAGKSRIWFHGSHELL